MASGKPHLSDFATRIKNRANVVIVLLLIAIPFVVHGARQSVENMRITPEKWISTSHPQRQVFEEFRKDFEGNDVVFVAWPGSTINDPRLKHFQAQLTSKNQLPKSPEVVPFDQILTGPDSLETMTSGSLRLDQDEAINRLSGFLIGQDGETSCAVVVLSYDGNEHRDQSIAHIVDVAVEVTQLDREEMIVSGPPHDGVVIDAESIRGVNLFGTISTLVAALVCFWCLKSWRVAGVIIGVASLGQGLVLSIIFYSGMTLDAILIVIPPLVFVLTVSAGIHFVNYFTAQPETVGTEDALRVALDEGWKPCWLGVITTAVGLCSLSLSRIQPVATFGRVSSIGLLISVGVLMCLLPDAIRKWPLRHKQPSRGTGRRFEALSNLVIQYPSLISLTFGVLILSALVGTKSLTTSVDVTGLFSERTKIIRDYQWIEANIGATVPVEVVVHFDRDKDTSLLDQVRVVDDVHRVVGEIDGIQAVMSAKTFLPDRVLSDSSGPLVRQAILRRRLFDAREELDQLNYFSENAQQQSWRITGRVPATAGRNYGGILNQIQNRVTKTFSQLEMSSDALSVEFTGMMPLIESVQVMILGDLFWSLLTAFTLIGIAIFLLLRQPMVALVVTFLNTLPVLLVFGSMGMLSIPIDIGTMMTAGVAMGIAVDDTVHFLCYFHRRIAKPEDRLEAIRNTIATCGAAMLQTTFICATSMLVFSFSEFVPTRQFGFIMAAILATAVVCDLVCLPAILMLNRACHLQSDSNAGFKQSLDLELVQPKS